MTKTPKDMNKYRENDELGREELLEQLSNAFYDSTVLMRKERIDTGFINKRIQAQKEIVALIKKPQVTEEFIDKWADELYYADYHMPEKELKEAIRQMFKGAGYQIKARVTEEWIEERAREMCNAIDASYAIYPAQADNFIRKLVEEVRGK